MTTPGILEAVQWGCKAKTAVVVHDESHPAGKRVIADRGTEEDARLIAASKDLLKLAQRVAMLNRDAGEIGAGMLASLVDEARRVISLASGEKQ